MEGRSNYLTLCRRVKNNKYRKCVYVCVNFINSLIETLLEKNVHKMNDERYDLLNDTVLAYQASCSQNVLRFRIKNRLKFQN